LFNLPIYLIFCLSTTTEKPSPPSKPDVKEVTARSIYLTWAPGFDGNAAITEYTVEFKPSTSSWQESEKRVVKLSTGLLVDGLRPASNYDLRVYAENRRGQSEASRSTSHVTLEAGKRHSEIVVLDLIFVLTLASRFWLTANVKAPALRGGMGNLCHVEVDICNCFWSEQDYLKSLQSLQLRSIVNQHWGSDKPELHSNNSSSFSMLDEPK